MFDRLLLSFVLLVLTMGLAQSQPSTAPGRPTPEACQAGPVGALSELEKRRQVLERDVAQQAAAVERVSARKDGKSKADADARAKELRQKQEDLLEVLFQIECERAVGSPPEAPTRNPFKRPPQAKDAIEVTTYYATNRKPTGNTEPAKIYGGGFESALQYGRAVVSIPPSHTPGKLELPTLWKLERDADPASTSS